jgi:hypothetical protein
MMESVATRYSTKAADFYRLNLRAKVDKTQLNQAAPNYEDGRNQLSLGQARSYEEIMVNNGQFGSHLY